MKRNLLLILSLLLLLQVSNIGQACEVNSPAQGLALCKYEKYTVWLSCKDKLAVLSFIPELTKDYGSEDTSSRAYFLDVNAISTGCQQKSKKRYAPIHSDYDVGHLSAIDHFDNNIHAALETNAMTNMVPQAKKFNRTGAWKRTETLVECYRDSLGAIEVLSGVIFGKNPENDHFGESHGIVRTPDYLWKLVLGNNQYDAWIMVNSNESNVKSLKHSRRSIEQIISTLSLQNEAIYLPVIKKLKKLNESSPTQTHFKYIGECHSRKG